MVMEAEDRSPDVTASRRWSGWAVPLFACAAGACVGYGFAAYPVNAGTYALPRLRDGVRQVGEPSAMDKLYSASLAACGSFNSKPALEMEGTRIRLPEMRPLGAFLDDYKITGTDERQFAKVVCRTFLVGKQAGLSSKDFGVYEVRKGAYDD